MHAVDQRVATDDLSSRVDRLARAASAGDPRARERLVAALHVPVLRFCRARLAVGAGDATAAEDIAQDTLIAVLRALPTFDHDAGPLLAFSFTVARNKIVDTVRRGRISRIDLTDQLPDRACPRDHPDELSLRAEQARMVRQLLDRLPERHRLILTLRIIEGLSAAETAERIGSTAGSVRVTQHRALTTLRHYLAARPVLTAA